MSDSETNESLLTSPASSDVVARDSEAPQCADKASVAELLEKPTTVVEVLPRFLPRQRRLLHFIMLVMLGVLCVEWLLIARRRPAQFTIERGTTFQTLFVIDINSANWIEWSQLEGIGPSMAHRIVAFRKVHGPFRSIEDLLKVPGIGGSKLDAIRPRLTIRYEQSESKYVDEERRKSSSGTSAETQQPSAVR